MNYYPHHIGDYLRDTAHLTMLEDCAYRRLLDIYYANERPLPKGQIDLYRLVRARSNAEKLAVDIVIGEFFSERDDGWHNKRADEEILKSKDKSDSARASANARWGMRTHSERNAKAMLPITNNQEPKRVGHAKGSRLSADWFPSDHLTGWVTKERVDLDLPETVAKFKDYWLAIPGAKGVKLDWDATFRNWVRSEKTVHRRPAASGEVI